MFIVENNEKIIVVEEVADVSQLDSLYNVKSQLEHLAGWRTLGFLLLKAVYTPRRDRLLIIYQFCFLPITDRLGKISEGGRYGHYVTVTYKREPSVTKLNSL